MRGARRQTNWSLIAAGVVFLLFLTDILAAKFQMAAGNNAPLHIGDTAQFLLLFLAVILFVIGTLKREKEAGDDAKPDHKSREPANGG